MKIALAQICSTRELDDNLRLVEDNVRRAAEAGAALVIFPEATMRAFGHNLTKIAEPLDGPWASRVRELAKEAGISVVVGMFTLAHEAGKVRNTLLVIGPDSETYYDKIHLYDAYGFAESDTVEAGTELVTFSVDEGTHFGLAICYDVRFAQQFIELAREGAQAVIVPASWASGPGKLDQWRLVNQARGVDSTAYILACGQADPKASGVDAKEGAPTGIGHSMVISPRGEVLAEAGEAPELLFFDLDTSGVESFREELPVLRNAKLS